ncbi:MAG: hypothetical protein J5998_09325, partial [Clostridia bacterium]|nr:hypothetical protein [Clostridia bacterium]
MNQSIELLRDVVRAARDGDEGIRLVMGKTDDTAFRQALIAEQAGYQAVERDAGRRLVEMGGKAEPESMMARAGMWMGMQMQTIADKSTKHLADLLIQGSTMGVTELTRSRGEHKGADADSAALCDRLIQLQQGAIEHAKGFLS